MSMSCRTALGVSPSPQAFSRGYRFFSTSSTSTPRFASQNAAEAPPGPPPTTSTWGEVDMRAGYRRPAGSAPGFCRNESALGFGGVDVEATELHPFIERHLCDLLLRQLAPET